MDRVQAGIMTADYDRSTSCCHHDVRFTFTFSLTAVLTVNTNNQKFISAMTNISFAHLGGKYNRMTNKYSKEHSKHHPHRQTLKSLAKVKHQLYEYGIVIFPMVQSCCILVYLKHTQTKHICYKVTWSITCSQVIKLSYAMYQELCIIGSNKLLVGLANFKATNCTKSFGNFVLNQTVAPVHIQLYASWRNYSCLSSCVHKCSRSTLCIRIIYSL